jgi:hypothetical protein
LTEGGEGYGMYGLVLVCFDYSKAQVDEFNDWYDTEHIPERERTRVMLKAQRWLCRDNPRISVAAYDLKNVECLRGPEYLAITGDNQSPWSKRMIGMCKQLLRFEGRQIYPGTALAGSNASAMLMVGVNAPIAKQAYPAVVERLARASGVVSGRIFEGINDSVRFLELYELESPEVADWYGWERANTAVQDGGASLSSRAMFVHLCDRYVRQQREER